MAKTMRVLVGVDGSEGALKAVRWAADLVARTGGSITLLNVIAPSDAALFTGRMTADMTERTFGEERMHAAMDFMRETKASYDTKVEFGNPAEMIIKVSEQGYDLVVVGSRGLSAVQEFLLGGVSSRVVAHSKVPVVVVP